MTQEKLMSALALNEIINLLKKEIENCNNMKHSKKSEVYVYHPGNMKISIDNTVSCNFEDSLKQLKTKELFKEIALEVSEKTTLLIKEKYKQRLCVLENELKSL